MNKRQAKKERRKNHEYSYSDVRAFTRMANNWFYKLPPLRHAKRWRTKLRYIAKNMPPIIRKEV